MTADKPGPDRPWGAMKDAADPLDAIVREACGDKHAFDCQCARLRPVLLRFVLDRDHEWAQWHEKWVAAVEMAGRAQGQCAALEKAREQDRADLGRLRKLYEDTVEQTKSLTEAALQAQRKAEAEIERLTALVADCEAEHPPEPWAAEMEAKLKAAEADAERLARELRNKLLQLHIERKHGGSTWDCTDASCVIGCAALAAHEEGRRA